MKRATASVSDREVASLLSKVIAIPSVSGEEEDLAHFVAEWVERNVTKPKMERVPGRRHNVIWSIGPDGGKPCLHFDAHMDTYPPTEGWNDPYSGRIANGRVYGIGSTDDKGGLASLMVASKVMKRFESHLKRRVVFSAVPGHLEGGTGVRAMVQKGFRADCGVVCEPTDLKVVCSHMASLYFEAITKGIPALDTHKHEGYNAILAMLKVIEILEQWERKQSRRKHPLLRSPLVNVGTINGGFRHNIVPDKCRMTFSIRYLPGQTPISIKNELEAEFRKIRRFDPSFRAALQFLKGWYDWPRYPLEVNPRLKIVSTMRRALRKLRGTDPGVSGEVYWTDASIFTQTGTPTIVCGPGSEACYWYNENIKIRDLTTAAQAYVMSIAEHAMPQKPFT